MSEEGTISEEEFEEVGDGLLQEGESTSTSEELSDIEQEAISKGWNPQGVEGRRNLTAEEFLDRQPLYDKIHKSDRAVKRLQEQQEALMKHLEMLQNNVVDRTVEDLKRQKKEALEEEDHDRVIEIDEKIIKAREAPEPPKPTQSTEVFDTWVEENTWYEQDAKLRRYADAVGAEYAQQYGEITPALLNKIALEVKETFPDKFNGTRTRPSPVEGAQRGRGKARAAKYSAKDLDEDARNVMRTLVRNGTYSNEQEYISALEKSGYFS